MLEGHQVIGWLLKLLSSQEVSDKQLCLLLEKGDGSRKQLVVLRLSQP